MSAENDLLSHAFRCERLAEACMDATIATKFRQLAQSYRDLAEQAKLTLTSFESCHSARFRNAGVLANAGAKSEHAGRHAAAGGR